MNEEDIHSRKALMMIAGCGSVLVLILLYFEDVSPGALVLVGAIFLLWFVTARIAWRPPLAPDNIPLAAQPQESTLHLVQDSSPFGIDHYYVRLFDNLDFGWIRLQYDHDHTLHAMHNVERSLDRAIDIAESTGLLAGNAMMTAAECGEVGRGFVSVSRDLLSLGEQSAEDLGRLRRMVRSFIVELHYCQALVENPLTFWLVSSAGLPVTELVKLRTEVERFQRELNLLGERYRRTAQADVRWLQLGDAVKRLIGELINSLYQLELHLQDVLSDMRLLQLSHGMGQQIVEIKDRLTTQTTAGEPPQKFLF